MATRPKYKAKYVYWNAKACQVVDAASLERFRRKGRLVLSKDVWRFDSQHEFKVYLELCRMYEPHRIARQVALPIFEPGYCFPNGKNWKVDFGIFSTDYPKYFSHFVEAKGVFLPEFAFTLGSLEEYQFSIFRKLRIVFTDKIPSSNKVTKALLRSDFRKNLLTLKELEKSRHLP